MADATYSSGEYDGGTSSDRITLDDIAAVASQPLAAIMPQLAVGSAQENVLVLADGSFSDLTGSVLALRNAANAQNMRFGLGGDVLIRGANSVGEIRDRDFLVIMGPYDLKSNTAQVAMMETNAKIVCEDDSRIVYHHLHTETANTAERGARSNLLFRNNNAASEIRMSIHSGPATEHSWTAPGTGKINGAEIVHWDLRSAVTVRDIDWRAGYIDFRPQSTSAAPTRGIFRSGSGVKFLGTGFSFTVSNPNIYGNADASFEIAIGNSSEYWLFGVVGASGDYRIVVVNLAGPNLSDRFAMYCQSSNRTGRFENHLVLDYRIIDAAGAGIEDAQVRVHARTPTYSAPSSSGSATVSFPSANAVALETTSDSDGDGVIGTADGDLTTALCIEAFGRRIQTTGGDTDGAYASAANSRAAYASHTALTYDVFKFGYEPIVGTTFTAKKSGETGNGKQNLGTIQLATDSNVTSASDSAVPSSAGDFDDVYDLVHKHAINNEEAQVGTVEAGGVLDFGSRNVTLASGGSFSASSSSVTVPCDSTVEAGDVIASLLTTGTITVNSGVTLNGPIEDSTGVRVLFEDLPANHQSVVAAWPLSDGLTDRTNLISASIPASDSTSTTLALTLEPSTDYYYVADAVTYRRSSVSQLNTAAQSSVNISLERITDAQGNDLVKRLSALTAAESNQVGLLAWAADYVDIDASSSTQQVTFAAAAHSIEVGQSSAAAQGSLLYPARIESGRIVFPSDSDQKWRRKATLTDSTKVPRYRFVHNRQGWRERCGGLR